MRVLASIALFAVSAASAAEATFPEMLVAAERGDSMARVVVGYTYYFGTYRDGTSVEQNVEKAYAWASLANYQGNSEAQKLLNLVIPKL